MLISPELFREKKKRSLSERGVSPLRDRGELRERTRERAASFAELLFGAFSRLGTMVPYGDV